MGLDKIFGSSGAEKRLRQFTPAQFSAPGLTSRTIVTGSGRNKRTTIGLTRDPAVNAALGGLTAGLAGRSAAFRSLRERVAPGFGDVTRARVRAIRDAGSRTVGNLREELARRRVGGSSFAQREIAGVEAMFAQEEERARAEGALSEIGATAELIQAEFSGAIEAAQALVNQFNFESSVAAQLTANATQAINSNLQAAAGIAQARREGIGEFVGALIGTFTGRGRSKGGGGGGFPSF